MKNTTIKIVIAAIAAASSANVSAALLTHESYTAAGNQQMHYVLTNGALYEANSGSNADSVIVENQALRAHYRDVGGEGLTNRDINCTEADGDNTEGLPESWRADQINTYVSILGGQQVENSGLNADTCDISIGPQGQILSGWNANEPTTFGAVTVTTFTILTTPRRNVAFAGSCGGTPIVDINTAFATNALYDLLIEQNGSVGVAELDTHPSSPPKPDGCTTYGISRVAVGQCDPSEAETGICVSSGAKSVPVPAFAAAALGLGLIGITYLTGRRRNIG